MTIKNFEKKKPLDSSLDDFIVTSLDLDDEKQGPDKLISFCVSQIHNADDEVYEIIRFDCAHGYCHAHKFYRDLQHKGEKFGSGRITPENFHKCKEDIKDNWKRYKAFYVKKWLV
jgi:hypothetical protein